MGLNSKSPSIRNYVKAGFGLGLGVYLLQIIAILIGLAFFIPGYKMMRSAKNRKEETPTNAIVLMVIGVVLMGGLGFGVLLEGFE